MKTQAINLKQARIHYGEFLTSLGFDWQNDPHMKDTPTRVVKMWHETLAKSKYNELCKITSFENDGNYTGLVIQNNIEVKSMCAHHHMPFIGKASVAYIPGKAKGNKIIGLSKLNRIVDYYCRMPNVQETLTKQIHQKINEICIGNRGVAVIIKAEHTCVSHRGIGQDSTMTTSELSGKFFDNEFGTRIELFNLINLSK